MLASERRSRTRLSAHNRAGIWAEALESRRLLVATPINVASGLTFAIASPLPSLVSGMGLPSTAQAIQTVTASVSPAPAASPFGPTATGPSTTLSPLPNDNETAVATASEVARPTPGRSDRISSFVEAPEIIAIPRLRPHDPVVVIPGPEIEARPPAPPAPDQPPAEPIAPVRPVAPAPVPEAVPEVPTRPSAFEAWDVALDLCAMELTQDSPGTPSQGTEGAIGAGALLVAWGGWKYGSRFEGRSRRRPIALAIAGAGPGGGAGR